MAVGAGGTHVDAVVLEKMASTLPLTTGLSRVYPFNGSGKDLSGNSNDGAVHGATLTTDRYGTPASAYQFDGKSSYIEMVRPLSEFTSGSFSVWITAPLVGFTQGIFFEGDTASGFDFALYFESATPTDGPNLIFNTKDNAGLNYVFGPRDTTRWFHVVGVADAARNRREMWIDGALIASGPFSGSANVGRHYKLQVGRFADGGQATHYFKGKIDDLRIYNRALSADEIEALRLDLRIKPTVAVLGQTTAAAVSLSFNSVAGKSYTWQSTTNLPVWIDIGQVAGDGAEASLSAFVSDPLQLFRLRRD